MTKSSVITAIAICAGFTVGAFAGGIMPTVVRVETQQFLEHQLKANYPITDKDIQQGRHVAAGYAYANMPDVIKWYYATKLKYEH